MPPTVRFPITITGTVLILLLVCRIFLKKFMTIYIKDNGVKIIFKIYT